MLASRMKPCPQDCGGRCRKESARCLACSHRARIEAADLARTCSDCGVPGAKLRTASARCRKCEGKRRVKPDRLVCQGCGGQKANPTAARCWTCYTRAFERQDAPSPGVLDGFSAAAFRALLDRSDIEWPVKLLADRAGVGVQTIRRWLAGLQRPRVVEWQRVAAVLALEPCVHCAGAGVVDPTAASLDRLTAAVTERQALGIPASVPPIIGAGWTLDQNALRLTIGTVVVRLTRQEANLVAALAQSGGVVISAAQLSQALGNAGAHAALVHLSRLRRKVAEAGADLGTVVDHVYAAGYRANLEVAS